MYAFLAYLSGRKKLTAGLVALGMAKWFMTHVVLGAMVLSFLLILSSGRELGIAFIQAVVFTALVVVGYLEWRRRGTGLSYRDQLVIEHRKYLVRKRWPVAVDRATNLKAVPRLKNLDGTDGAVTFTVYVPTGMSNLIKAQEDIRRHLGGKHLWVKGGWAREIVLAEQGRTGVVRVTVYWKPPLERVTTVADLPMPTKAGMLCVGVRADGKPAEVPYHLSAVIGGSIGSGKSNDIWTRLLGFIRADIPVELWVSDCKGGMELAVLKEQVGKGTDKFRVAQYVTTQAATVAMLKEMHHKNLGRANWLAERGLRQNVPTPENPMRIALIDETLLLPDLLKAGIQSPLGQMVVSGRATGHAAYMLAQMGQKEALGPVRDVTPIRTAYRTTNDVSTNMFLGDGAAAAGADCAEIPVSTPGVGYTYDDDSGKITKFRSPYITDSDIRAIAAGKLPKGTNVGTPGDVTNYVYDFHSIGGVDENDEYIPEGALLYIGVTDDTGRRFKQHQDDKPWAHLIDWDRARAEVQTYKNRAVAESQEKRQIKTRKPLKNIAHNGAVLTRVQGWRRGKTLVRS